MDTSSCTRDLGVPLAFGLPAQAMKRKAGELGKGNPRSCSGTEQGR